MLILAAILLVTAVVGGRLAYDVSDALPDVGRDAQGDDPWDDPIGIQKAGDFQLARVPDCASAPVVKISLWDEASRPYWQVSGPPLPMSTFVVGVTPAGFTEDVAYRKPKPGAVVRLVAIRRLMGAAGVRYRAADLRSTRVKAMLPLQRFTVEGFQTADVCGKVPGDASTDGSTTTTSTAGIGG